MHSAANLLLVFCTGCGGSMAMPGDGAIDGGPGFRDVTETHLAIPILTGRTMDAAAADVDGDGDLDLMLAMEFEANLLLINDGTGRFSLALSAVPDDVHDSEDIGVADFDGNGALDAVVVSEDDTVNELYLGNGDARFAAAGERIPVEGISNAVAVADINGDDAPDILIGNNGQNRLLVNDGVGNFTDETAARLPPASDITQDVEFGDADGDGDLDILVGNEDDNRLLINNGSGVFADESAGRLPLRQAVEETREADFGDVDGDGQLDLFFANVSLFAAGAVAQNRLLINGGDGVYSDETDARLPPDDDLSFDGDLIDLDRDGDLDIATANGLSGNVPYRAYRNDGTGNFTDATAELFPSAPAGRGFDIEFVDVNGDGLRDLYLAGRGSADLLLLAE